MTGIEPASPAWKAGALAIVLHLHEAFQNIVSLSIIAQMDEAVKIFLLFTNSFSEAVNKTGEQKKTI